MVAIANYKYFCLLAQMTRADIPLRVAITYCS
jgi:hypothetical protein